MGGQKLRICESRPPLLTFSSTFGQFGRNNFGGGNSGGAAFDGTSGVSMVPGVFGGVCSDKIQRGNGFGERGKVLGVRGRGIGRSRGSAVPRRRHVIIQ